MFSRSVKYGCSGNSSSVLASTLRSIASGRIFAVPLTATSPLRLSLPRMASVAVLPGSVERFSASRFIPASVCVAAGETAASSKRTPRSSPRYLTTVTFHGPAGSFCEAATTFSCGVGKNSMRPFAARRSSALVPLSVNCSMSTSRFAKSSSPPLIETAALFSHSPASSRHATLNCACEVPRLSRFFRSNSSPSRFALKG